MAVMLDGFSPDLYAVLVWAGIFAVVVVAMFVTDWLAELIG
jgi:hypothetical protein